MLHVKSSCCERHKIAPANTGIDNNNKIAAKTPIRSKD